MAATVVFNAELQSTTIPFAPTELVSKVDPRSFQVPQHTTETIKPRSTSISTGSSCTVNSVSSDLSSLDAAIALKIGTALESIARAGDANIEACRNDGGEAFESGSGRAPSISLSDYLSRMLRYVDIGGTLDWELLSAGARAILSALIFIDRLISKTSMQLNSLRVHRLLAAGILVALKTNEDAVVDMKFYASLSGMTVSEMKKLETSFLRLVDWDLVVSKEEFAERISTWRSLVSRPTKSLSRRS